MLGFEVRQTDGTSFEGVVIAAVLELFSDSPADLEPVVRRDRDVPAVEQHVKIRAKQHAVRDVMHSTERVRFDVRRLQHRECSFAGKRATPVV